MKTNCSHPVVYNVKGHLTCISCGAVLDENQEPEKEQEQEPEKEQEQEPEKEAEETPVEAQETPVEAQEDEKKDKPSRKRKAALNDK